jgi:hypothetical protein
MKGEEGRELQGVAEEEQRGRQHEASEAIENWLRMCPVGLSERVVDAVKLLVGLEER